MRLNALALVGLAALLTAPASSPAAAEDCPLALVLALDASSSVDAREYRLQAEGVASALMAPDVAAAIIDGGGALVMVFEWSGREQQVIHAEWAWLGDAAAIANFAERVRGAVRRFDEFPTSLGHALGFAGIQLSRAPRTCRRQVVDMSGDGVNNDGFGPASAYKAQNFDGVTVNGLVIKGADPDPEDYYRHRVIRGAAAFVEIAEDYQDYARAMRRKLLREITGGAFASLH